MLCDQIANEIVEFSWGDGPLGPFTERHLRHCAPCRQLTDHHTQLRRAFAELQARWEVDDVADLGGWVDDWRLLLDRDRRNILFEEAMSNCRRTLSRRRSTREPRRRPALTDAWHELVPPASSK